MGAKPSVPRPPTPERPMYGYWTQFSFDGWDENSRKQLLEYAEGYWPLKDLGADEDDVEFTNILLLGPIHAGKTSFFNTISSVFQGRISMIGRIGEEDKTLTLKFRKYPIFNTSDKREVRFRLCDCRGMENVNSIQLKDIEAIVDGHMKDGYTLNSEMPIKEGDKLYEANPKLSDRVHVVVFVIDANNHPSYLTSSEVMSQIERVTNELNKREIPQFVLMNKVDGLREDIRGDICLLFRYKSIKNRLNDIARNMRVAPLNVLPMCNYFEGGETNTNMDILALYNIQRMLRTADDYLSNFKSQIDEEKPLKTPWKEVEFSEERFQHIRDKLEMYSPKLVEHVNILTLGPSDSEKTDFINLVYFAIHRCITAFDVASGHSSQRQFRKYKSIKRTDGSELAVRFCDCVGFEDLSQLSSEVLQQILDGKVKHGTQIDAERIDPAECQKVQERIHCVVYVIPATMTLDDVKNQYRHLTETVAKNGIPQMGIVTKMDSFRHAIKKKPQQIYFNAKAKEYIQNITKEMHVRLVRPMVHNDSDEFNRDHSILCLNAMQDITAAADNYLENLPEDKKTIWEFRSIRVYNFIGFLIVVAVLFKVGMDMIQNT